MAEADRQLGAFTVETDKRIEPGAKRCDFDRLIDEGGADVERCSLEREALEGAPYLDPGRRIVEFSDEDGDPG